MSKNKPIEPTKQRKKTKLNANKLIIGITVVIGLTLLVWMLILNMNKSTQFEEVVVKIKPLPNKANFLNQEEILDILDSNLREVPFQKTTAEILLEENPYIKNAEVYTSLDQTLNIKIVQREPIARVINQKGHHFYLDEEGNKFKCLGGTSARVVVVNGFITEKQIPSDSFKTQTIKEVYQVCRAINKDLFWKQFTEQLYVDKYDDIILIPKVGNFTIVLGNSSSLAVKLKHLRKFIETALPKVGWDKYKQISVKYKGQIVATKR